MKAIEIENGIDFTREEYEKKQNVVSFDEFLNNIVEVTEENNGSLEDAIFIAEDAFRKL